MASATGCSSVSGSSRSAWGTPLSVRMKSSAVSAKTNSPLLVFTNAGTSTRFDRTERAGVCEPADDGVLLCALAATPESKTIPEITLATHSMLVRRSMGRRLANSIHLHGIEHHINDRAGFHRGTSPPW